MTITNKNATIIAQMKIRREVTFPGSQVRRRACVHVPIYIPWRNTKCIHGCFKMCDTWLPKVSGCEGLRTRAQLYWARMTCGGPGK